MYMIQNKNIKITIGISVILFVFIVSLIYLLYCYSYYDDYQKEVFTREFNSKNYDNVYDNLKDGNKISRNDFNKVIDLMYNKNTLNNIYNMYYIDSSLYKDNNEFIDEFYYGDKRIDILDIEFYQKGKTTLFNRSDFYYERINLTNSHGFSSSLGVLNNVILKVEDNSSLKIDSKGITCNNDTCTIEYMFMGLHEILYESNGYTYYGILNVTSNVREINVTVIDSLIRINKDEEKEEDIDEDKILFG